ncbi:MAG: DNA topoisomerase IB [Bacteroidota bacterium]
MKKELQVSHNELLLSDKDHEKAANAINLIYIKDTSEGITRRKTGKKFTYLLNEKIIRDKKTIERIKKLVIPPAWSNVWICKNPTGHIQATGFDVRNRKQYIYHEQWKALRSETKFHRLYEFGKSLADIRKQVQKDIAKKDLTESKVLATLIAVMDTTYIRIGNAEYEKTNGSYGLTTLKDKHVTINGNTIRFSFKGKKGIDHDITIKNKRLAKTVKQCRDIPGKELFQYYDPDGNRKSIDSGMVNNYIRQCSGHDFSAKDFRTWAGSLIALENLCAAEKSDSPTATKKTINDILTEVSRLLGNTRSVCKKYYVHPTLLTLYEEGNLLPKTLKTTVAKKTQAGYFNDNENVLMKILNQSVKAGYRPAA